MVPVAYIILGATLSSACPCPCLPEQLRTFGSQLGHLSCRQSFHCDSFLRQTTTSSPQRPLRSLCANNSKQTPFARLLEHRSYRTELFLPLS